MSCSISTYVKMSWKDVITTRLSKEKLIVPNETKLSTSDLVDKLVEKDMIPAAIKNNATLHEVLLTQILLKTLDAIEVPPAPQNREEIGNGIYLCRFSYRANAKEMLLSHMGRKNAERVKDLERETGVNLEHYHKLSKRTFVCAKDGSSKKRKLEST